MRSETGDLLIKIELYSSLILTGLGSGRIRAYRG